MLWTPTCRARALTAAFASRRVLSSPCYAAPSARRPPPRRRRGWPAAAPRALSHARMSTTNTPESYSSHSFARSPTPDPGTPPPPSAERRCAQTAVDAPLQGHSARADPAISTARASRSSLASSRRLSSTRTPSPSSSAADPPARIVPPLHLTPTSIPATSRCARTW